MEKPLVRCFYILLAFVSLTACFIWMCHIAFRAANPSVSYPELYLYLRKSLRDYQVKIFVLGLGFFVL